jgi:hypothetical protein
LSGSTTKKVVLERFDREPLRGFVHQQSCLTEAGVELLSPDGSLSLVPYVQVKMVCFVRELEGPQLSAERREYQARPKTTGLWIGLKFRDGDRLEGTIPNSLLLIEPYGFTLTPPEVSGNTQRVFVPRQALADVQVLGVVGSPLGRGGRKPKPKPAEQITLFSED